MLLGIDRSEVINNFSLQTIINKNASLQIGYTVKNSSIDYFDEKYPRLGLTFLW